MAGLRASSRLTYLSARSLRTHISPKSLKPTTQWHHDLPQRKLQAIAAATRTFTSTRQLEEKKYTRDHEWIELNDDGKTGTIGISTYAAKNLGDVVYVELPTHSLQCSRGDAIGAVESVKSASDIMTPISGTIVGVNEALQESPGLINKDPEGEGGWIARIEVGDVGRGEWEGKGKGKGGEEEGVEDLMSEVEYGQFVAE